MKKYIITKCHDLQVISDRQYYLTGSFHTIHSGNGEKKIFGYYDKTKRKITFNYVRQLSTNMKRKYMRHANLAAEYRCKENQ